MYSLIYTKEFSKQLEKLDKKVKERIILSMQRLIIRPYAHIKKLVNSPYFSFRVGNYRVIIRIDEGKLLIIAIDVGHRRNIYK
ncbi:type II toxin-antitoxin system RelE/ParE family toxin [Candidatus Woesearchaeota archaeon]|nr:type II toxin-antitoxin system RelE/ParE family toxin [Candidatus Woesearchaeota archaeon]